MLYVRLVRLVQGGDASSLQIMNRLNVENAKCMMKETLHLLLTEHITISYEAE